MLRSRDKGDTMRDHMKLIVISYILISISIPALASSTLPILRLCNQAASKEQEQYENEYVKSLNESLVKYNNKKLDKDEVINPEKKMKQIELFSSACEASFYASNNGLEINTFKDYLLHEVYTKSDIPQYEYDWFKPIFIRMVDYGYSLSAKDE